MGKLKDILTGLFIGISNAVFGSGGGMIAVPYLNKKGLTQNEAQATAITVILPLTVISCTVYYFRGNFDIVSALKYIPFGFVGAIIGSFVLKKAPSGILRKAFSLFMIWAGLRLIFR